MGFLHMKCPACGRVKGFFTKTSVEEVRCRCGARYSLDAEKVVAMRAACPCCEREVRYLTNRTDQSFTITCFACEAPIEVEFNERKGRYESY